MSFTEDLTELGRAIGRLLIQGEMAGVLDHPEPVLAARQILLSDLVACFETAARVDGDRTTPHGPTTHPVRALAVAMRSLTTGSTLNVPSQVLEQCGETDREWAAAARSAIALEMHIPVLGRLEPAIAWTAIRDLACIAATIPYLDADLARRLPADKRPALGDLGAHADLRIAAEEVVRLAGTDSLEGTALVTRTRTRQILNSRRLSPETSIQSMAQLLGGAPSLANRDITAAASAINLALRRTVHLPAATIPEPVFDESTRRALQRTAAELAALPRAVNLVANSTPPDARLARLAYLVADTARRNPSGGAVRPEAVAAHAVWAIRASAALSDAVLRSSQGGSMLVPVESDGEAGESLGLTWAAQQDNRKLAAVVATARRLGDASKLAGSHLEARFVAKSDVQASGAADSLARVTRELDQLRSSRAPSPVAPRRPQYPSDPPRSARGLSR